MAVYVDTLLHWGMKYRGKPVKTCHMATDGDLQEVHEMAVKLGLRKYFQPRPGLPHYDLMVGKREEAVKLGAIEVDPKEFLRLCKRETQ